MIGAQVLRPQRRRMPRGFNDPRRTPHFGGALANQLT
jgi:hypothetical protein